MNRVVAAALASALAGCAHAAGRAEPQALQLSGEWKQGELIMGHTVPGATVTFEGRPVRVSDEGLFIVGLDRDEKASVILAVDIPAGGREEKTFAVAPREYDVQRIDGLPPDKVTPPASALKRIQEDQHAVHVAREADSPWTDFARGFIWPAQGRISGVYGSQRILNGVPKQPHYGVDVAGPPGTPVRAPAGGLVTLAVPDMYYTGGTLMIDHGHGLTSAFLHMRKLLVHPGDRVRQGDVIGELGATGRATGPHLDWRMSWFDARIDPQRLVPPMPALPSSAPTAEK